MWPTVHPDHCTPQHSTRGLTLPLTQALTQVRDLPQTLHVSLLQQHPPPHFSYLTCASLLRYPQPYPQPYNSSLPSFKSDWVLHFWGLRMLDPNLELNPEPDANASAMANTNLHHPAPTTAMDDTSCKIS